MPEWFEEWFGEAYLHLYSHRDDADAEHLVELIVATVRPAPGRRVLDVACGAGRHAHAFQRRGFRTVGVDLSLPLLRRARQVAGVPVARVDMRALPVRPRSMDLTVNLFTSFGYFADDFDHMLALREMLGTLQAGGWFVLDFLNAAFVEATLVPSETLKLGGADVQIRRGLSEDGRFVTKTIAVANGQEFHERVRLYRREELVAMVTAAGGRVRHQFGSYQGAAAVDDQPRAILLAQTR